MLSLPFVASWLYSHLKKNMYVLLNRAGDSKVVEIITVGLLYNVHFKELSIKTKLVEAIRAASPQLK